MNSLEQARNLLMGAVMTAGEHMPANLRGEINMWLSEKARLIKKQTPLEILEESMKHIRDKSIDPLARKQAEWALAQIEAAK